MALSKLRWIVLPCCAICFYLPLSAGNTETSPANKQEEKKKRTEAAAAELDRIASGLAPSSGKLAVVQRLEALFKGNSDLIVPTKAFTPLPPYISMHELPPRDKLSPPRMLIIYRLRFMQADDKTQDAIEGIVGENGSVEISADQNTVIINVEKSKAEGIRGALIALDQPLPQILVETQIIEVQVEQGEERDVQLQYTQKDGKTGTINTYGYNLDSPGQQNNSGQSSGFNFFPISTTDSDGGYKQLQAAMKWLNTSTDAKILASPNIIAALGTEAKMTTGEELPYQEASVTNTAVTQSVKFKKTGINLTIKPVIINKDTVRLEIKPEIILAVRYQTFKQLDSEGQLISESSIPVVSIRNISTTLMAADGEIIMLGGLYSSETTERLRKTPFFSTLPVLGDLFTAKDSTTYDKQLFFFMKIHILKSPYSVLTDPENNAAIIQDIGRALRDSRILFKEKSKPDLIDHKTFFSIDSFWNPKSIVPEYDGSEAGPDTPPAPKPLNPGKATPAENASERN